MARLGVNVDHIATVREARRVWYPDPVEAARLALAGGADSITVHLREDRRHIKDADVERVRLDLGCRLNLEMAAVEEMIVKAALIKPDDACLVPEKREEITTEGGLEVAGAKGVISDTVTRLKDSGIRVSLFIDALPAQIEAAKEVGADAIELHTGPYAESQGSAARGHELELLRKGVQLALSLGLQVNAGHGLRYDDVAPVATLHGIDTLNIGHSVIARALFVGIEQAVREMRRLIPA